MKILGLDSSQIQATVCLIEGGQVRDSRTGSIDVAHSEALLPYIDGLLRAAGLKPRDLDAFGVGVGPGSFTGIRIGCATIKALAQVTRKKILPFSSLRATALSAGPGPEVVALVNAYQGQVFAGWTDIDGQWREDVLPAKAWLDQHGERLKAKHAALRFQGTAAGQVSSEPNSYISASGIAAALAATNPIDYVNLSANYLRPSQAELKLGSVLAK